MGIEIPAPRDAEGKEIDIDSCEVLYNEDGEALEITFWQWVSEVVEDNPSLRERGEWTFNALMDGDSKVRTYYPSGCYIDRPDSLRRLAEDVKLLIRKSAFSTKGINTYTERRNLESPYVICIVKDIMNRVIALAEKEEKRRF